MKPHAYLFFLDGINYRLVVGSSLVLECWMQFRWAVVPTEALEAILQRLVDLGISSPGFIHTIRAHHLGMRIEVSNPRWRRWLCRSKEIVISYLDLDEVYPWVSVRPTDPTDDLPVVLGPLLMIYRSCHPAGVWGIWAFLHYMGYVPCGWGDESQTLNLSTASSNAPQAEEEEN